MAHVTQTTFATRLKETMEERSLKQVDLVQLASERGHKLGKSQLSQYLSGKTEPRPEMLNVLSELLGVSTDRLRIYALLERVKISEEQSKDVLHLRRTNDRDRKSVV